jgi:hypothetical protein
VVRPAPHVHVPERSCQLAHHALHVGKAQVPAAKTGSRYLTPLLHASAALGLSRAGRLPR